jgi:hypothetical protein
VLNDDAIAIISTRSRAALHGVEIRSGFYGTVKISSAFHSKGGCPLERDVFAIVSQLTPTPNNALGRLLRRVLVPQQTQDVFCDSIAFRHRWFFARGIGTMTGLELDGRQIRRFTRTPNRQRARVSIRPYDLAD